MFPTAFLSLGRKQVNEPTMSECAVILVLAHKSDIKPEEALALSQCASILGGHDIVVVCPSGMDVSKYREISDKIKYCHIHPWWQRTYDNFNRLKISPLLYWKFRRYDFILFYELDAFVFKDELNYWCSSGYDYIGAPWFYGFNDCTIESPVLGVGNGGFSLRRTSSALRVLRSFSYIWKPRELFQPRRVPKELANVMSWEVGKRNRRCYSLRSIIYDFVSGNNTFYLLNDFGINEDFFWGLIVPRNFSWFKVAPPDTARRFSIECNPRRLFEANGNQLPFGCHAWQKYDPEFWDPHIARSAGQPDSLFT